MLYSASQRPSFSIYGALTSCPMFYYYWDLGYVGASA